MKRIWLLLMLLIGLSLVGCSKNPNSVRNSNMRIDGEDKAHFFYELELKTVTGWKLKILDGEDGNIFTTPEIKMIGDVSLFIETKLKPAAQIVIRIENKTEKLSFTHDLTDFPGEVVISSTIFGEYYPLKYSDNLIGDVEYTSRKEAERFGSRDIQKMEIVAGQKFIFEIT